MARPKPQFMSARLLSRVQRGGWRPVRPDGAEVRRHSCRVCWGQPEPCLHDRPDVEAWKREKEAADA